MADQQDNDTIQKTKVPQGENNKRTHPRMPIELKVEYKKLNSFFFDYTRNISKGGTFIKTSRPLPVGTQFLFTLMVPGLREPLTLKGQVRWIINESEASADSEQKLPGMGIQFIYDADDQQSRVAEAVERLMIEQLGERAYERLMQRAESEAAEESSS